MRRNPTEQLNDLESRDKPLLAQTESEAGLPPERLLSGGGGERRACYSLHPVTGPDSLASLIAQRRDSPPSLGSSCKESFLLY